MSNRCGGTRRKFVVGQIRNIETIENIEENILCGLCDKNERSREAI